MGITAHRYFRAGTGGGRGHTHTHTPHTHYTHIHTPHAHYTTQTHFKAGVRGGIGGGGGQRRKEREYGRGGGVQMERF